MDIESEIRELKRRVGDLEGTVSYLTGHVAKIHPELVALSQHAATRFDSVETLVGKLDRRLDVLTTQLWSLRDDLPDLLAVALRESGKDNARP